MLAIMRHLRQSFSWKFGYGCGHEARALRCPWWPDKTVYAFAYVHGRGIEIPAGKDPASMAACDVRDADNGLFGSVNEKIGQVQVDKVSFRVNDIARIAKAGVISEIRQ
jgi:hypothetical protein